MASSPPSPPTSESPDLPESKDELPPAAHRTDARGFACPIPVLLAVRDMLKLAPGEVLELVGDDPGIVEDIPAWATMNGHRLIFARQQEGLVWCRVEKGETDDPLTRGPIDEAFFEEPEEEP